MAVVQISRIQHRRGRKNAGSGLPQLASAELGWAVDTQELFIGNGSVSEGAPQIGNTKILTENDNLFDFADAYTYKSTESFIQTGSTVATPVERSLQQKLDDHVSAKDFGATGDGSDQTAQLQRAIDQIYINNANKSNPNSRQVLILPPGLFKISATLYIPPFVTLQGAGIGKTIIQGTASLDATLFKTVNGTSTPGFYANDATSTSANQARNISISDCTIESLGSSTLITLQTCKDSVIARVLFKGERNLGDGLTDSIAIVLNSQGSLVGSNNNKIKDCEFVNLDTAVKSDFDIQYNLLENCIMRSLRKGISYGEGTVIGLAGQSFGPSNNTIEKCRFETIEREAISIGQGTKNYVAQNRFYTVGNDGGTESSAQTSVVSFLNTGNFVSSNYFDRSISLGYDPSNIINVPYVPEISGPHFADNPYTHIIRLSAYGQYSRLFKLPASNSVNHSVDYLYQSDGGNAVRSGTMSLTYNENDNTVNLVDDYDFNGDAALEDNLEFRAVVSDEDGDGNPETVVVEVINSTNDANAELQYQISTRV